MVSLDADDEVRRYLDQPVPPTLDDIRREVIPRWLGYDIRTSEVGYWVAEETDGRGFLGWFHLRPPKQVDALWPDDLELGYRLRRDCWGHGLATEGGGLLLQYAFDQLGTPRVMATALRANSASIRVMEKLGLKLECHRLYKGLTPEVVYAITAAQWRSQQA